MVMNPRTHPRGAPPDFALPKPNPNPTRMTDALWWLVCMRLALEPLGRNGGTFADKKGYHNAGQNLPDFGPGNSRTDHSIRRSPDRSGPWWKSKCSAHDWTFVDAQNGDYRTIDKYTTRLVEAMQSPTDLRPDDVYAYTLGQMDGDVVVEGYSEYTDDPETSADKTHNWHRHDSMRRNIIGSFPHMWKALTIDMGWTYVEWQRSVAPPPSKEPTVADVMSQTEFSNHMRNADVIPRFSGGKVVPTTAPNPTVGVAYAIGELGGASQRIEKTISDLTALVQQQQQTIQELRTSVQELVNRSVPGA